MRGGRLAAASILGSLVLAATVAAVTAGGEGAGAGKPGKLEHFRPEPAASAAELLARLDGPNRYPVARVRGSRLIFDRPDGTPVVRIAGRTEWGTPRVLGVVGQRRNWLAVLVSELANGEVGWIRVERVHRLQAVTWSLHADLSRRELVVRRDGRRLRRIRVGIGRPGHATPTGRFAVTDRLRVTDRSSPYGCCVLALTGHQTRLPPGWPGGNRLAVHATADLSGLGREVSLGCMRSHPRDVRWLLKHVPLGSPVFIRA